jgi:glycosyltransferase involved in cell wall biosynthesis
MIAVVIPCYRVKHQILNVFSRIGPEVSTIIVVDDFCPEQSGSHVKQHCLDSRVEILYHQKNKGVGGAMITGLLRAKELNTTVVVKIDGDGQMDPALISDFVGPILEGLADYTKGNRFYDLRSLESMPRIRLFGNTGLSFLAKVATGYWGMMDPTNGYLAIHRSALALIPVERLANDYFFETDLLFRLNTYRAVLREIPMKAHYGDEKSNLNIRRVLIQFPVKYLKCFLKRLFYTYVLRDFNLATLEGLLGIPLLLFGASFGAIHWYVSAQTGIVASVGTVMTAALPIIIGFQMLLAALSYDVGNVPKQPLQKLSSR